jgi:catechol 2,3-dioxygenase-like lactoylglutathione lyase family enzyme
MNAAVGLSGPILWITLTTADLAAALEAWCDRLGLPLVAEGVLSPALAARSGAPDLAGARWALIGGEVGALRLVEAPGAPPPPLATLGWAAAELSVSDLDAVHARALAAGFGPLGAPRGLGSTPAIRAAQLAPPGGGAVYLTDIRAYDGPLDLHRAAQALDRVFIAVLASPDLERDRAWLEAEGIGRTVTDRPVAVPVLQKVHGLAADETIRISSMQLAGGCLIEIDGAPPGTPPAPHIGGWPLGIAMVTLACPAAPPGAAPCPEPPYDGRPVRLDRLPSGALLERVGP